MHHSETLVTTDLRDGRLLGGLMLVQLAGLIVPFVMLGPIVTSGYLSSASSSAGQIRSALVLLLGNGAIATAIAITQFARFRIRSVGLARWLVVLGAVMISLQAIDNTRVMEMLVLSKAHAAADGPGAEVLRSALGPVAAATRHAAHYSVLLVVEAWMLIFYAACWRCGAVPWILPAGGMLAASLHVVGVTMPVLLGTSTIPFLAMFLAVSHLALALRLLTRGFDAFRTHAAPPGA
jgi:hypothetical protein